MARGWWYIRNLDQGLISEEFKKKAFGDRSQGNKTKSISKDLKRKLEGSNTTPPLRTETKRKMVTSFASGIYATVVKTERVAILPKGFPKTISVGTTKSYLKKPEWKKFSLDVSTSFNSLALTCDQVW